MNPFIDVALPLVKRFGFHLSPPIPVGCKHPVGHKWKNFQDQKAPEHLIRYWGINYEGCNYGILTGEPSNLVVLEADSATAENIIRQHCQFTPLILRSGSRRG